MEGWCIVCEIDIATVCEHDLVRNQSNTYWACSKCGWVFVGGNKALGKRVRQSREEAFRGLTRG